VAVDLEIYIRDSTPEQIIRWVQAKLGPANATVVEDGILYLRTRDTSVVVTTHIEGGEFSSLALRGRTLRWAHSETLARDFAVEENATVRWCTDGTDEWLQRTGSSEPVKISWTD
jgi:hypothetical protein